MNEQQQQVMARLLTLQEQEELLRRQKKSLQAEFVAVGEPGTGITAATRNIIEAATVPLSDDDWARVRQSLRCLTQGKRYFHSGEKCYPDGIRKRSTVHIGEATATSAMTIAGYTYAAGEVVWAEDLDKDREKRAACEPLAPKRTVDGALGALLRVCRDEKLHPVVAGQKLAALDDDVFATMQAMNRERGLNYGRNE